MKLSAIAVVAAAGLVTAAPLRVVIFSEESAPVARIENVRFGQPIPPWPTSTSIAHKGNQGNWEVPIEVPVFVNKKMTFPHPATQRHRRPCGGMKPSAGARFRSKAIEISNAIRQALGFPLIEFHPPNGHHQAGPHRNVHIENGFVSILPVSPTVGVSSHSNGSADLAHPRPHHRHHIHGQSFMGRLHYSLMNLGPWEGRAVAFVLGCGIGVLLRMMWVLFVVAYRAVKGSKPEEHVYTEVVFIEDDTDDLVVPPPTYVYPVDEKAPIEESK